VLYGGILIWGAGSRLHFWARIATALDLLWILGTLLLLFTDWLPLTTAGNWLLALAGLGVLVFAILQLRELRTVIA